MGKTRKPRLTGAQKAKIESLARAGKSASEIRRTLLRDGNRKTLSRDTIGRVLRPAEMPEELRADPHMERLVLRSKADHAAALEERLRYADDVIDGRGVHMAGASGPWALSVASALFNLSKRQDDEEDDRAVENVHLRAFRRYVHRKLTAQRHVVPPLPTWEEYLRSRR